MPFPHSKHPFPLSGRKIAAKLSVRFICSIFVADYTAGTTNRPAFSTMDTLIPYFSHGAWYAVRQGSLSLPVFLILLFFIYRLSDYRRGVFLSLVFTLALALGMTVSCAGWLAIRSTTAAFVLPALATLLAAFNIFGASVRPSALLEKTGFACCLLFGLTLGLAIDNDYGSTEGTVLPLMAFNLGMLVGTLILSLVVLCLSSLVSFFGINRRDFTLVVSAVAIGLLLPLLIRHFPFILR